MKNVLILHGADNNSSGNWFPWLEKKLEGLGYNVWLPDLPRPDSPDQDDWVNFIFSNKEWNFDEDSVIVGHSAGATLVLRILEKLPSNIKIDKAILVAGFVEKGTLPQYFKYKLNMLKTPFSWDKIKSSCNLFYFVHSDNDKYQCGESQGKIMRKYLGGELIIKSREGHLNLEEGERYRQFPEILQLVNKDAV